MKRYLLTLGLIATFFFGGNVWGQTFETVAEDAGGNYNPPSWTSGTNQGQGFGQWTLTSNGGENGFAGHFVGNPSSAGISGMSSQSFGLFSNPNVDGNEAKARRFFSNGEMQIGDVFTFQMGMNFDANNSDGFKGIDLINASGSVLLNFNMGNSSNISYGLPQVSTSGTLFSDYGTNAMNFTITRINETEYRIQATPRIGSTNFDQTFDLNGNIAGFELYSGRLDSGDARQIYFNEFKIERPSYTTIADGDFSSSSTWANGDIPNGNGIVNVNHNVFLDENFTSTGEIVIAEDRTLTVNEDVVLTNRGIINVNGDLVFKSTATGTAQYGNSSGTIIGNVTVERFIPKRSDNKRAFRFLSSPVSDVSIANSWQQNMHVTGAGGTTNGFDATDSNSSSMFTFDNQWVAVGNTNVAFLHGRGYRTFVRGDRTVPLNNNAADANDVTLSAKGTLATGSVLAPDMASGNHQFSFVGNPYQAVVDLAELGFGSGIENGFAYYWDPTLADNGAFVTITTGNTDNATVTDGDIPSPGSTAVNKFLQPGQAVFFRNTNASGDRTITFTEASKSTGEAQTAIFSEPSIPYVNMRLYEANRFANGGKEQDAIGLRFFENGNNAIDSNDAAKMGNTSENLALVSNNQLLSIESRALPEVGEVYSLFTTNYQHENYVMQINLQNFPADLTLKVNDTFTQESYVLETGINEISFSVDPSIAGSVNNQRFNLEVGMVTLSVDEVQVGQLELYPNPVANELNIHLAQQMQANEVSIFNLMGKEVLRQSLETAKPTHQVNTAQLSAGVYLVRIQTNEGSFTQKLIKK